MCSAAMLCCSCPTKSIILILDVSFSEGFGGGGGTAATRRISMKGRWHTHRGIIISHSAYTQSTKHTHRSMHIYNALTNPAHRSSDSWASAYTHTRKHNQLKRVAYPFMTNHFHLQLMNSSPHPSSLNMRCSQNISHAAHAGSNIQPRQLPFVGKTTRNSKLVQAN